MKAWGIKKKKGQKDQKGRGIFVTFTQIWGIVEPQALPWALFWPSSLSTRPYLGLSIIAPATLSRLGIIVVPVWLCVRLSGVYSIIAPALLTLSRLCVVPAGLSVALGVAFLVIPAARSLFWILLIFRLRLLLCSSLFSLQRSGDCGAVWRFGGRRKVNGRREEDVLVKARGAVGCNKGHDPGLCWVA